MQKQNRLLADTWWTLCRGAKVLSCLKKNDPVYPVDVCIISKLKLVPFRRVWPFVGIQTPT